MAVRLHRGAGARGDQAGGPVMNRRGLRRLPPFKDYLFRAVVLMTLSIFVIGFTLSRNPPANPPQSQGERSQASPQSDCPKTFWEKLADDPTAFFTMVLAVLTATLAGGSVAQIYFLLSADRTTRLAARAAIKSAEVAARTVSSIENITEKQLRAYVLVESAVDGVTKEQFITGDITFKNFGQTPALNVIIRRGIDILPIKGTKTSDNLKSLPPTVLGPESRTSAIAVLQDVIAKVAKISIRDRNAFSIIVFRSVEYQDVFGK